MTLKEKIHGDLVTAMKAKDELKVWALRMVQSAVQMEEKKKGTIADDDTVIRVIGTLIKQRKESAEQYRAGKREDLAQKELSELTILETYMPQQLAEEEILSEIRVVIAETGGTKIGQIMPVVMKRVAGRAEGKVVSALVQRELQRLSH